MAYKKVLVNILSYLIIGVIFLLLFVEFKKNWASIQSFDLKFDVFFILLSFFAMVTTYLLTTYGWHVTLNTLSGENKITFLDSVAIVNTSNLTKYIPGKVWSYALQTYWLAKAGFSNSLIVFTYIINILTLIITFLMLGLCYLAFSPVELPFAGIVSCLLLLVVFDILFITFYSKLFNALMSIVGRIIKQDIAYCEAPTRLLLYLQLIHFISAFSYGIGAYFMCLGIGFDITNNSIYLVMSSMIISDIIGFLAIIVPSGLGVREGIMYLLLKGGTFRALSLILPIATRVVIMFVDVFLGAIGFVLLKNYKAKRDLDHYGK